MKTLILLCVCFWTSHAALDQFFLVRNCVIKEKNDLGRFGPNATAEECAARCVELGNCRSFEYKPEHQKCDLSSATVDENDLIKSAWGWEIYSMYPYRVETAQLTEAIATHVKAAAKIRKTMAAVEAAINATQKRIEKASAQLEKLIDQRDGLGEDIDTVVAVLQSQNDTMSEVVATYEEILNEKEELEQEIVSKEAQISKLEKIVETLTGSVNEKDVNLREIYSSKARVETELAEVNGQVSILHSRSNSLSRQVQQLEDELDAADDPKVYVARDCYELYKLHGVKEDGVYDIYPFGPSGKKMSAYCYMGDGGGWTVIQRRDISSGCAQKFDKTWNEYKNGFGSPSGDYWLGNDAISSLTTKSNELKVYVKLTNGHSKYSHYSDYQMDTSRRNYRIKSIKYAGGNAGDQLSYLKNYSFGTKDKENNNNRCSTSQAGGFWFKTTRYCANKGWWSCSRYAYRCSTTNINARSPSWSEASHWTIMRIRTK